MHSYGGSLRAWAIPRFGTPSLETPAPGKPALPTLWLAILLLGAVTALPAAAVAHLSPPTAASPDDGPPTPEVQPAQGDPTAADGPQGEPTEGSGELHPADEIIREVLGEGESPLAEEAQEGDLERLRADHRRWLREVEALLSEAELEAFLSLSKDYQRSSFIHQFWLVRDPFPETARNEFRDAWEQRLEIAKSQYDDLSDARARALLLYGEPDGMDTVRCPEVLKPLEVWSYHSSLFLRGDFHLVLIKEGARDQFRLWSPTEGLYALLSPLVRVSASELEIAEAIAEECFRGDRLLLALETTLAWDQIEDPVPRPSDEWLQTFVSSSTDLPRGADTFPAELKVGFPGRHQSRTVVQGVVRVALEDLAPSPLEGADSYNLLLDGEIVRDDDLFESFRYRFQFPTDALPAEARAAGAPSEGTDVRLPLIFERYLRPGEYKLVVRARDLASGRYYREERDLHVPFLRPGARRPGTEAQSTAAGGDAIASDLSSRSRQLSPPEPLSPAPDLLQEANAALASGDHSVRLLPPPPGLTVGNVRVEARVKGEGVERVRFLLNERQVMSKRRPPFSVELDLGDAPRIHRVGAVVVGEDGRELARDEILVNAGPHRFAVRLVEPRQGGTYRSSLRARAVVEVPEGERLDRLEFYLNETRLATLYQPPFVQPVVIPESMDIAYVRAVAHLVDGNSTEDLVFVNAPDYLDQVDVQFVELYTTVLDRRGRPALDLTTEDFRVLEDGVEQEIRRFEQVEDIPIYAGVVMDTSASMTEELHDAVKGALGFFQTVITPKDRAAVITFNERHELAVRFTNNLEVLAGGVAGLVAEGETFLYDSLIYALYYFSGVKGKRALILISDGEDVGSHYRFDDVLDYARRSGVAVYTIGLGLPASQRDIQIKLSKLSSETGGRAFLIDRAVELGGVYEKIEDELRSQYLLAYQSSNRNDEESFREVEVEVLEDGYEAKTMRGYYP